MINSVLVFIVRHNEAAMIAKVVKSISSQLQRMGSTVLNSLVGMEAHMVKMNLLLNMGSENQVLFLGIWGYGRHRQNHHCQLSL